MSDRSPAAKVLTIMMTDIVGSTALRRARGDRDADDILGLQAEIVHDKVIAFGGRVRKSLGDGFLISFPSTVAAVRAAAAIQRALHEYNIANPQRAVEIRIGIHIGQVAERDGDLLGQAVHVAARVMAEAVGGQILTSDEVRKHAEPQVDWSFLDSGLFWLRGFPERWRLYEVSWNDTSAGARPSCCVRAAYAVRGAGRRAGQPAPARGRRAGRARRAGAGRRRARRWQVAAGGRDRRRGPGAGDAGAHRALR